MTLRTCTSAWLIAVMASLATGCGTEEPKKTTPVAEADAEDEDTGGALDSTGQDSAAPGDAGDTTTDTGIATDAVDAGPSPDGEADGVDAADVTTSDDAIDAGKVDAGPDVVKPKSLPLPDCAGPNTLSDKVRCANCLDPKKCEPLGLGICGPNGKTYINDCDAICDLQAFQGLATIGEFLPKPCPTCAACTAADKPEPWCVTLKSGAKVDVAMKCEAKCVDFKADGLGNPVATKGACKTQCSKPAPDGGGCSFKYAPVCAKEDGKTYSNACALQNCDLAGCYGGGGTTPTAGCVADKMTAECEGECYDATKTPDCPNECAPVCGIDKNDKGLTYRNLCIAEKSGAKSGDCDGVTTAATCAATELYKGKGCCPDVPYEVVQPLCASRTVEGKPDEWISFRNQSEFECLKGSGAWTFQYGGPCICNCSNEEKLVCGGDLVTYTNSCQAVCYNGAGFAWTKGPC